jgi:hypothetical protein
VQPDPRGDRLHPQHASCIGRGDPVEGDELEQRPVVARQGGEDLVQGAGVAGGVDPLLDSAEGVRVEQGPGR